MSKRYKSGYTRKQVKIIDKTGGACILCGDPVTRKDFSQEHLLPKSRGGSNKIDNLWACHQRCNEEKGHRTLQEFTDLCDYEKRLNYLAMEQYEKGER